MPMTEISKLSAAASVWIFGITPAVSDEAAMLARVDQFLRGWVAHQVPVLSGRELRDGCFLIVAAEKESETSGCSIDSMFGLIRGLEREFGVALLDANRIFYRDASGAVTCCLRNEFGDRANEDTLVCDIAVQTLGQVRSGAWERPARESWHSALLRRSA